VPWKSSTLPTSTRIRAKKNDNTNPTPIATITVKTSPNGLVKRIVSTKIEDLTTGINTETQLNIKDTVDNYDFDKNPFDDKKYKSREEQALSQTTDWIYKGIVTDTLGGKKNINLKMTGSPTDVKNEIPDVVDADTPRYDGSVMTPPPTGTDIWKEVSDLIRINGINFLIESPPLATIFHECDWKDWVNIDYPGNINTGSEFELKDRAYSHGRGQFQEHVCGNQDDDAHYIDAVTMETQTPWYELYMENKRRYETFKLTPTFGYACKDNNGPGAFCKDMKVRYCCARKQSASWGDWGDWAKCSKTCGGGMRTRKRDCKQLSISKGRSDKSYKSMCYGQGSEFSSQQQKRFSEETEECEVQECPSDHKFEPWSAWTKCSVTCSQGTKKRERICRPASGGGVKCPPFETNKDLFYQEAECTQEDCEIFKPGGWTQVCMQCHLWQGQENEDTGLPIREELKTRAC